MANSEDPVQMQRSGASDLGLHCLLGPNTKSMCGNLIEQFQKSFRIRLWILSWIALRVTILFIKYLKNSEGVPQGSVLRLNRM